MNNDNRRYKLLSGFDDPGLSPMVWNELLSKGASDVIFLTWHWQKAWWDSFGRGQLLLIVAEQEDIPIAIAPLFAEYSMLYFVGSGSSDYLDFIGDIQDEALLEGMFLFAVQQVKDCAGFMFYHIPEESKTHSLLAQVAALGNWAINDEGGWACPRLELNRYPDRAIAATQKKSLLRHEAYFKKNGLLLIEHLVQSEAIEPHLNSFFEQHITRWAQTPYPSLFLDNRHKQFFRELCRITASMGWLRFTRVIWNSNPIAYHFGFVYKGSFFWYKPTFSVAFARHSPGEVLLRQLLLQALEEEAHTFDFGLGEEAFKERFATSKKHVVNRSLCPLNSKEIKR